MIVPMTRVEVVCLRTAFADVIAQVQQLGLVHIDTVPKVVYDAPGFLNPVRLTLEQEVDLDELRMMEKTLNELMPLLPTRFDAPEITKAISQLSEKGRSAWPGLLHTWSRRLRSLVRRKMNLQDNISVLKEFNRLLCAVAPQIDARQVRIDKGVRLLVLKGKAAHALSALHTALDEDFLGQYQLVHHQIERGALVGLLTYPGNLHDAIGETLQKAGVVPVDAPDYRLTGQTMEEAFLYIRELINRLQNELALVEKELQAFIQHTGPSIKTLKTEVTDQLAKYKITGELAGSHMIGVLHGWIPKNQIIEFSQKLCQQFPDAVVNELPAEDYEAQRIPTLLHNHKFLRPFELLLQLYSPPTYGTIDPSIWVGVSFVMFYGFMMADVVYGAALFLLSWWVWRKWGKLYPVACSIAALGCYMGFSTTIFGLLFGEYLGDLGSYFFGIQPIWVHRISGAMTLMYTSIIVGFLHIATSLLIGIWQAAAHHEKKHLLERLGMFCGLLAIGLFVLSAMGIGPFASQAMRYLPIAPAVFCVILLVWALGVMALLQMIEVISLATNVMSYTRLMALGMASTAIADVGNHFAEAASNPFVGVSFDFMFHVLNIALGLFSPTLHALRLNYVESLPKFYDPKGTSYKPFRKEILW